MMAVPVAVLINGFRVFLTGFLIYYVDPGLGEGFMHWTEGLAPFMVAMVILGVIAWGLTNTEERLRARRAT